MTSRTGTYVIPNHIRDAAIADYHTSGDTLEVVAARHNIGRSTLGKWVKDSDHDELAYVGGWEIRGGILHPLLPGRRAVA